MFETTGSCLKRRVEFETVAYVRNGRFAFEMAGLHSKRRACVGAGGIMLETAGSC